MYGLLWLSGLGLDCRAYHPGAATIRSVHDEP
jgi:hypothetical protein